MYSSRGPHESRQMPLKAATMPEATRCRSSVATGANDIQSDGEFQIARIEIYQMIRPLGRDVVQQFLGQIAVRVYDPNAVPERDVLQDQVSQQGGFSRAGLADDVEVLPFVHGGNAKGLGIAPAGLLADDDVRGLVVHGAKTSRHPFARPGCVGRGDAGSGAWGHAGEIMAAGFGIRTGRQLTMRSGKWTRHWRG